MAFDPDAYLAQKKPAAASGFDPDAYLAQQREDAMPTGRTWAQVGREAVSNIPESGSHQAAYLPSRPAFR